MSIPGSANPLLLASAAAPTGYEIERSLRFNSADSAYLSRTFASSGNRKTWTWAGWVKRSGLTGVRQGLFVCTNGAGTTYTGIEIDASNKFTVWDSATGGAIKTTTAVYRDVSAWYHVILAIDTTQATASNRIKLYVNGSQVTQFSASTDPALNADLQVNAAVAHSIGSWMPAAGLYLDGYLADIHFIDGQALDPTSFGEFSATTGVWVPKAYTGTYGTNGFHLDFADNSSNTATTLGKDTSPNGNNWTPNNLSVSSVAVNATAQLSNLVGAATQPTTYSIADIGNIEVAGIGANPGDVPYLKFNFSALGLTAPATITFTSYQQGGSGWSVVPSTVYTDAGNIISTFTSSGNLRSNTVSIPTGATYFALPPSYTSVSGGILGNSIGSLIWNGASVRNYNPAENDSLVDVPTNGAQTDTGAGGEVRGNYCTLNPLAGGTSALSNGNLQVTSTTGSNHKYGTIGIASGKFYWEHVFTASTTNGAVGISNDISETGATFNGIRAYLASDGNKYAGTSASSYGASWTLNDVMGIALDMDSGSLTFYKNGVSQGVAFTGLTGTWFPLHRDDGNSTAFLNFGQRPFAYTAPSGFKALNTANLPAPVITKPSTVMDVALYTGNNTARSITGLGFSPDFVWLKARNNVYVNALYDTLRGAGKSLVSNSTAAELDSGTGTNSDVIAFNSDGWNLGSTTTAGQNVNINNTTYAAWAWDAGSSTVTNTQGSISSQVRANASAGFSVVTWTLGGSGNQSVGHGLGVTPGLIITKRRNTTSSWTTWFTGFSNTEYLWLESTQAKASFGGLWGAGHTSSVIGFDPADFYGSGDIVAYCFAPVAGYSAFGSYTGNGSADGPFVYLGFRPALVIVKMSSSTGNWTILDTKRVGYNVDNDPLYPNLANAEGTTDLIDITSNGFKVRTTDATFNTNAGRYVYAAWAESPFQYSRAR